MVGSFLLLLLGGAASFLRLCWQGESDDTIRRSEERLRISQRIAHVGSWDWDLASGSFDCSEECCRILGIAPAQGPVDYQGYLALLSADDREPVATAIGEALAGEHCYAVEHRVGRPDGSERFVSEVGEVFRDGSGKPLRVVSVVHDITERKEAESALFFEKRYRALIENLPQRIFLKDCNSVYLSCNSSFARELGLQPGEVFGKTDHDLFDEPLARKRLEDDARVMAAGTPEERDQQRERDGRWVSKALIPLKDDAGRVYGLLGVLTDITLRKRAEEQLKESEERSGTPSSRPPSASATLPWQAAWSGSTGGFATSWATARRICWGGRWTTPFIRRTWRLSVTTWGGFCAAKSTITVSSCASSERTAPWSG